MAAIKKKEKSEKSRAIALLAALVLIIFGAIGPYPEALGQTGLRAICIMLAAVVLWISEALPVAITCLLLLPLLTYFNVLTTKEFYSAACSSPFFFTLAGFGISAALMKTKIPNAMLRVVLKKFDGDTRIIIRGFFIMTAVVSLFVSNGTAVISLVGLAVAVIEAIGNPEPGTSQLAKGLMLALPFGAMCGGIATPASNGLNVTLLELLKTTTGTEISFLQWCAIGIPASALLILFGAWYFPNIIKPEKLEADREDNIREIFSKKEQFTGNDYKFLIIVGIMITLWILSNWIKIFDTTRVALIALGIMFLPGINLLNGKEFMSSVKPLGLIILAGVMPLASAMSSSGAGKWLVDTLFGNVSANTPTFLLMLIICVVALIIHMAVPAAAANASLNGTLMFPVAAMAGIPGAAALLALAAQCGNNYLFCIEAIYAYTFTYDHYTFADTAKYGWPLTLFQMLLCCTLIPVLARLFGLS